MLGVKELAAPSQEPRTEAAGKLIPGLLRGRTGLNQLLCLVRPSTSLLLSTCFVWFGLESFPTVPLGLTGISPVALHGSLQEASYVAETHVNVLASSQSPEVFKGFTEQRCYKVPPSFLL